MEVGVEEADIEHTGENGDICVCHYFAQLRYFDMVGMNLNHQLHQFQVEDSS